ncbi:ATP-dependent DNA helicase PIF1-like [Gordionus sp. m RMFG-2023]|uniref:ATP-dependent DNA helicase PIF1-like n=1 Tax=Gordionus sp. m RMFG-2023 TaxID=3053472 RepID=UPI0031FCBF19
MRPLSTQAKELKLAHLTIIDDTSMMTKHALRCIDALLREIMQINTPFGGKVILLGGNFWQTLPVIPRASKTHIIESCIKSSNLWHVFHQIQLTHNMRSLSEEESYIKWLLQIGEGKTPLLPSPLPSDYIEIPLSMLGDSLISSIYGDSLLLNNIDYLSSRIILTTKNDIALTLNNTIISKLPSSLRLYYSSDSLVSDHTDESLNYPPEFLHSLTPSGMPPHILSLKVGTIIILLRNMNPTKGLCNGTRLIIKSMHNYFLDAEIITGTNKGYRVLIPRIDLTPSESQLSFILKRRQFPILPAFVITINKSQGQTFDHVGLYFNEPVFSHGQLYVALSRCSKKNIKIMIVPTLLQGHMLSNEKIYTKNIVYTCIL